VNVTLKHLQAFVAVAQEGSFTRAARRLALSQPALTIQINQFEEELGVKLFDRTTRRVLLTDNGAEFLPTAERLLDDVETAIAQVRDVAARRRGRVGVATLPSIAMKLMPAMVAEFRSTYPGVSVHLLDANASGV
jgi:DNA-binding transcriptional LysR family regulator